MKIVWDEPKRLANLDKHGLDFADPSETFFDTALVFALSRQSLARYRQKHPRSNCCRVRHLGKETVSVISMRPVSKYERKLYAEY
jgi:uncharacterized DUF497 family protein